MDIVLCWFKIDKYSNHGNEGPWFQFSPPPNMFCLYSNISLHIISTCSSSMKSEINLKWYLKRLYVSKNTYDTIKLDYL